MENIDHELISNILSKFFRKTIEYTNSHEYNVASIAYNFAKTSYKEEFGDFNNYTSSVINSFLIEYCYKNSIPLEFSEDDNLFLSNLNTKEDIELLKEELKEYNISLKQLLVNVPKTLDDRNVTLTIAGLCLRESFIINYLRRTKKLPFKRISLFYDSDIDAIKKYNDYIIFLILVLIKDTFLSFKSYLNIKAGESDGS
ncbi:MAG: hypothetical protein AB6733_12775 [Clostridiaceae bacterium]